MRVKYEVSSMDSAPLNKGLDMDRLEEDLPVKLDLSSKAVDARETDRTSTADSETEYYWSSEAVDSGSDVNSKEELSVQLNWERSWGEYSVQEERRDA